MTSPVADFVVSLGSDGRILSQGTMSKALATSNALTKELKAEASGLQRAEETVDGEAPESREGKSGKLMIAEEVAEGHVSWSARQSPPPPHRTSLTNCSKTILHWNGGFTPVALLVHGRGQSGTYGDLACSPNPVSG